MNCPGGLCRKSELEPRKSDLWPPFLCTSSRIRSLLLCAVKSKSPKEKGPICPGWAAVTSEFLTLTFYYMMRRHIEDLNHKVDILLSPVMCQVPCYMF